jgi:hypothetical protein
LIQRRLSLALRNVIGSAISNTLGACSISVLFQAGATTFEWLQDLYGYFIPCHQCCLCFRAVSSASQGRRWGLLNANLVIYIGFICSSGRRGVLAASEH